MHNLQNRGLRFARRVPVATALRIRVSCLIFLCHAALLVGLPISQWIGLLVFCKHGIVVNLKHDASRLTIGCDRRMAAEVE